MERRYISRTDTRLIERNVFFFYYEKKTWLFLFGAPARYIRPCSPPVKWRKIGVPQCGGEGCRIWVGLGPGRNVGVTLFFFRQHTKIFVVC